MSNTNRRLAEGAAILALTDRRHEAGYDSALEQEIIARELRELEQDILADPGALKSLLVPVRARLRREERKG